MSDSNERWLPVPGWPDYDVSDQGSVRCWKSKRVRRPLDVPRAMPQHVTASGYKVTMLMDASDNSVKCFTHRLVLMAFVGPRPDGFVSCHGNGIRDDNRAENLRWGTYKDNSDDKFLHGRKPQGETHQNAKLTKLAAWQIFVHRGWLSAEHLGRVFGVSGSVVKSIHQGRVWASLHNEPVKKPGLRQLVNWAAAEKLSGPY